MDPLERKIAEELAKVASAQTEAERRAAAQSAAREIATAVNNSSRKAAVKPIQKQTGLKFDPNRNVYSTEIQFIPQLNVVDYLAKAVEGMNAIGGGLVRNQMEMVFNNIRNQLPILNAQINAQGENIQQNVFGFKGFAYDAANAAAGLGDRISKPLLEYLRPSEMIALTNSVRDNFSNNFSGIKLATEEGEAALTRYTIAMMRANNMSNPADISNFFQAMKFSARATEPEMLAFNKFVSDAASALQIPYEKGLRNFTYTIDQLGYSGDKGVRIFKGLQAAELATGVEFQQLGNIFERGMQTFDGIANTAGKLNAVLGISIDPMQLASMTADERFEYVQDAISQSGMDVTDPLIQRELESILGGSQTTRRILRSSTDEYDKILARIKSANVTQFRDLESANTAVTDAEKLARQRSTAVPGFEALQAREAIAFQMMLKNQDAQFNYIESLATAGARNMDALTLLVTSIIKGEIEAPKEAKLMPGFEEFDKLLKEFPGFFQLVAQVGNRAVAAAVVAGKNLDDDARTAIDAVTGKDAVEANVAAAKALSDLINKFKREAKDASADELLKRLEAAPEYQQLLEQVEVFKKAQAALGDKLSQPLGVYIDNQKAYLEGLRVAILNKF